jgi:hypothetical protein
VRRGAIAFVTAGLVATGCGGGGRDSGTTRTATTALPRATVTAAPATTTPEITTTPPQKTVIRIRIAGGKPVGGIKRVTVRKGQDVSLVVRSDVADEVHLHGYDLHADVEAGGSAGIDFKASIAGVFEAELESRKLQILELTVR